MPRYEPGLLDEIRERLPIEEIAARYTRLVRAGREFKGISPFNAERSPSFYVIPAKRMFHCFSSGKTGDVFRLMMEADGLTFPEAVEECARLVGVDLPERGDRAKAPSPEHLAKREAERRAYAAQQAARDRQEAARSESARDLAHRIWLASVAIGGTPAAAYLERRGVGFGAELRTLRFNPSLEHRDPETGELTHWPALVAAVQSPAKRFLAVWRIFLTPEGDKAPVTPAKQGLGSYTPEGGSVWLGSPGAVANVCEGIETGLGIMGLLGRGQGVQAALSTSGMMNFVPPGPCRRTLIWPDGDTDRIKPDPLRGVERRTESPGLRAANALLERIRAKGGEAAIQPPPRGKDFLDVYNASKGSLNEPIYGQATPRK